MGAAGSAVLPFLSRHHAFLRELHLEVGNRRQQVNKKTQRDHAGRAAATTLAPPGLAFAMPSPGVTPESSLGRRSAGRAVLPQPSQCG